MASYDKEERLCLKCGGPSSKENMLILVGAPKGKRKEECEKNPLEKLIEQSERLKLEELKRILMNNKATEDPTNIYSSCRTYMNSKTRAKGTSDAQDEQVGAKSIAPENVSSSTRSTEEKFDFKRQCFYCTNVYEYDDNHPDQNKFECV